MQLNHLPRLAALALVLVAPVARALPLENVPATVSEPPALLDTLHFPNDCHLSTLAYLAKFQAQFPGEHGEALVVAMHNEAGARWNHTVAVISWHGQAWVRDEFFGVFALDCRFDQKPAGSRLSTMAFSALERHARHNPHSANGTPMVPPPDTLSNQERIDDVTAATRTVPFATTIFWVRSGNHEIPVAFFRPSATQIAVYEPLHGTCLAECASRDDARIVSLVAARIGLRPDSVRAEVAAPLATLVASNSSAQ